MAPNSTYPLIRKLSIQVSAGNETEMVARLSALLAGRTLPSGFFIFKDSWYSFLLEAVVRPEGLGPFKKSTSSGLEPSTFRLAA
jgi:hypothetical protein